ncbi:putative neural-cadherin 2 isoform X1 [Macrobrachium nipponense]|uniref:putative neural-cadherin 2 isoform X1 n=1 Tax=Macrobrachium nipponense TaxID=159736 RepID=UPI0030C8BB38
MAINVVFPILIPLEENLRNATRLLSGSGAGPLEFTQPHYCAVLREDAKLAAAVLNVKAIHKQGASVRYSITGGNRDGLFTIDQHTGLITLAATLDYEVYDKHELVVSGEAASHVVHTIVQVKVRDVNDNPPFFVSQDPEVTVIEEVDRHLPNTLLKVEARDRDELDYQGLLYTVRGDGVDGYTPDDAYFTINSLTGEIMQQRALDRDPPKGKAVWKVRVQVRDGQALWSRPRNKRHAGTPRKRSSHPLKSLSSADPQKLTSGTANESDRRRGRGSWDERRVDGRETRIQERGVEEERRESVGRLMRSSKEKREARQYLKSYSYRPKSENHFQKVRLFSDKKGMADDSQNMSLPFRVKNITLHKFPVGLFSFAGRDEKIIHSNKLSSSLSVRFRPMASVVTEAEIKSGRFRQYTSKEPRRFLPIGEKQKRFDGRVAPGSKKCLGMTQIVKGLSEGNLLSDKDGHFDSYLLEHKSEVLRKSPLTRRMRGNLDNARFLVGYPERNLGIRSNQPINIEMKTKEPDETSGDKKGNIIFLKNRKRNKRTADEGFLDRQYEFGNFGLESECDVKDPFGSNKGNNDTVDPSDLWANTDLSAYGIGGRTGRVHLAETTVTIFVKDINDNPPVFPNATMFAEVQENGPVDLSVTVVSAWDADDVEEGANAVIRYSIEKNALHEVSGEAIFKVDSETGLITTAVCCLDRETTPEYHVQVVATDGGGLKGSGIVIIRLVDVNDNSPRLAKKMWEVEMDETWGRGPPDNSTLLEISVSDRDTNNYFFYRVVEESGWGWAHFDIRSVGTLGHLYARQTLDFEDETHRRGFKFMIQVTDKGRGGWHDGRHLDSAWVKVHLRDLNDNAPAFVRSHVHVTVKEDAQPHSVLTSLPAHDPDMEGKQGVDFRVVGGWGALTVDKAGSVSLWRSLDREASGGALGMAKVIALDRGQPPQSSTATLTISVTDVNDCPPRLLPPTVFHVTEGVPPALLGVLTATDEDVWALGHGPPFTLSLAPSNPAVIKELVDVKFLSHLDSGRGGAEVWTKESLDREQHRELSVEILLQDAGGVSGTQGIKVIVDDINDNPMKPASKTVYLWKTQGGSSEAPLGRVYVEDPDDWDLQDKTFHWKGQPHPLFSLNAQDGTILASSQVREGRYELHFSVDDVSWAQRAISANVTVIVRHLTQEALAHSSPITLMPTTPRELTAGWIPMKGGGELGNLTDSMKKIFGDSIQSLEIVSIYDVSFPKASPQVQKPFTSSSSSWYTLSLSSPQRNSSLAQTNPQPATCVWVSVQERGGTYMNPVKLQGILGLHSDELEKATNLTVFVERPDVILGEEMSRGRWSSQESFVGHDHSSSPALVDPPDPPSAASRASLSLPLQVVDTNLTSVVTPRLTQTTHCSSQEPETCTSISCLNGGRCIRTTQGMRCVCPSGTWGFRCKAISRTFKGSSFIWIQPIPACVPTVISLKVLTRKQEALLLYAGPLIQYARNSTSKATPLLAIQVIQGRVQMVVEGGSDPIKLRVGTPVSNGDWHTIHAKLDEQGASLMVDLCDKKWEEEGNDDDSHCVDRQEWRDPADAELWINASPIQLGGLAHTPPNAQSHGWKESPTSEHLDGCLSHLNINGQLMDLGEPALSKGSLAGCLPQESSCSYGLGTCGVRGTCTGGLNKPECHCDPGWSGDKCNTPTVSAKLRSRSYMKMALSFTPASKVMSIQVRMRTRGRRSGLIFCIGSKQSKDVFSLQLQSGIACASVTNSDTILGSVCVEGHPIGDGLWHTVRAERHGHNIMVGVDDADGSKQNYSFPTLMVPDIDSVRGHSKMSDYVQMPPLGLRTDDCDGVTVGGIPVFEEVKTLTVDEDLDETCLDDLRISGRMMPLAPTLNKTIWGKVASFEGVESGCNAANSCQSITCASPLSCINDWGRPICGCSQGRQLMGHVCEDVNECLWRPCLHGGSCYNTEPGFMCLCGPAYTGEHCQWNNHHNSSHPLIGPAAIAAVTLSLLFLVFVGVLLSLRLRRRLLAGKLTSRRESTAGDEDGICDLSTEEATIIEVKGGTEEGGGGGGGGTAKESALGKMEPNQEIFLESLHLKSSNSQQEKLNNSSPVSSKPSKASLLRAAVILEEQSANALDVLPAQDDLRAYAYEGEGSSAGSLSSASSDLKGEKTEDAIPALSPAFLDVMDLLKTLPEAPTSFTPEQTEGAGPPAEEASVISVRENPRRLSSTTTPSEVTVSSEPFSQDNMGDEEMISTLCSRFIPRS